MKRRQNNRKRLQLSKSTIRNLHGDQLRRVAGGDKDGTVGSTFFPICQPDTDQPSVAAE